jgi:lambda family phage portal protein
VTEKPRVRVPAAMGAALTSVPRIGASAPDPFTSRIGPTGSNGFEATRGNRRLRSWNPGVANLNSLLSAGGDTLRRRALDAARNNPYVTSALSSFKAHVIGTGIKPSFLATDPKYKTALQELWSDWVDEADADGTTDFYGQQAIMAGGLFNAGESFARFRFRRAGDGLSVPLQIQLLPAVMLPLELNRIEPNGNETRCGIEFSGGGDGHVPGKRVAYWFYRNHPGDFTRQAVGGDMYVRVPADEVCHVFLPEEEGQIRGKPWVTASLVRLYLLDLFDDAVLAKMLTTQLFGIAVTKQPGEDGPLPGDVDQPDDGGDRILSLSSGCVLELQPGEGVQTIAPGEAGSSYEPFEYRNLTAASAGMGVPYSNVTGDKSKANYSSERSAQVEFRRRIEQLQYMSLVFQVCRPVVRTWMDQAVLSGAVMLPGYAKRPRSWQRTKWIPQKWDWVDPLKDRQAEQIAVIERWKSRSDVIEAEGYDAERSTRGSPPTRRGKSSSASRCRGRSPSCP